MLIFSIIIFALIVYIHFSDNKTKLTEIKPGCYHVITKYGELLERTSPLINFYDAKLLPYPKPIILQSLYDSLSTLDTTEIDNKFFIDAHVYGITSLASFQDNVGNVSFKKSGYSDTKIKILEQFRDNGVSSLESFSEQQKITLLGLVYNENDFSKNNIDQNINLLKKYNLQIENFKSSHNFELNYSINLLRNSKNSASYISFLGHFLIKDKIINEKNVS